MFYIHFVHGFVFEIESSIAQVETPQFLILHLLLLLLETRQRLVVILYSVFV